jgi:hypothetical protein
MKAIVKFLLECMFKNMKENNNPTNSLKARAIDGIHLKFVSNTQGGHELMNLSTGQIIKRRQVSTVPITNNVIKCAHRMVNHGKVPDRLKIKSKTGVILHDNTWLPGVHYSTTNEDKEEEM